MTVSQETGAPLTKDSRSKAINWKTINWKDVEKHVKKLQFRIAKAIKSKRYNKAKALQWILTHSFYAKLLAIKRVTQNKGKNTPGVDRVLWKSPNQKMQAVKALKRRGYQSKTHSHPQKERKT
jgi:RNA-directed DNA polymerase